MAATDFQTFFSNQLFDKSAFDSSSSLLLDKQPFVADIPPVELPGLDLLSAPLAFDPAFAPVPELAAEPFPELPFAILPAVAAVDAQLPPPLPVPAGLSVAAPVVASPPNSDSDSPEPTAARRNAKRARTPARPAAAPAPRGRQTRGTGRAAPKRGRKASGSDSSDGSAPTSPVDLAGMPLAAPLVLPPAAAYGCSSAAAAPAGSTSVTADRLRQLMENDRLRQDKLRKKADQARESRRKKKMKLNELEDEVSRLQEELRAAREKHESELEMQRLLVRKELEENGVPVTDTDGEHRGITELLLQISGLCSRAGVAIAEDPNPLAAAAGPSAAATDAKTAGAIEAQITVLVDGLVACLDRKARVTDTHLLSLDKFMTPALPTRFLEWLMTRDEKFYVDPAGLWASLFVTELAVSPDQLRALLALRDEVAQQRALESETRNIASAAIIATGQCAMASTALQQSFLVLAQLNRLHLQHAALRMSRLRAVLTPLQTAKFLDWVARFGQVCIKVTS